MLARKHKPHHRGIRPCVDLIEYSQRLLESSRPEEPVSVLPGRGSTQPARARNPSQESEQPRVRGTRFVLGGGRKPRRQRDGVGRSPFERVGNSEELDSVAACLRRL